MEAISFLPLYEIELFGLKFSQTIIASVVGTIFFVLFVGIYNFLRKKNPHNKFTNLVDMGIEGITNFFQDLGGNIPLSVIKIVVFVFVYVLWCNVVGLIGDLFVLAAPILHYGFRPVSTDIFFNITLASICVIGSIIYGFKVNGHHYIEKYIGYKGLGIVPKVNSLATFFAKIFDIVIGLFIGLIEFVGELARVLSLALRLFGNILAGMVLLGLIVTATMSLFKAPAILPLVVVLFELFVGFLQAFVFSMLVLVYFKVAGESHH